MGGGASASLAAAVRASKNGDLKATLQELPPELKEKLKKALSAAAASKGPFDFASGLPDCCTSNPESYTVLAEVPNARLVQMKVPPGGEDKPHEHPAHSMYFVTSAKLAITLYKDGKPDGEPKTVEIPAGSAPIFPPGGLQVKNVGDSEVIVIFGEALPACKPRGDADGFIAPFTCSPRSYKILAQDDDWITGEVNMEPGAVDKLHNHKDPLIYVLSGDEVTLYPEGNMEKGHAVPIRPFAGIPAPCSAGPIFTKHCMKNSGKTAIKMLCFEMKKWPSSGEINA